MIDNGCNTAWFGLTNIKSPYNYEWINGDYITQNDFNYWMVKYIR